MKTIDAKQCTAIALGRLGENEYTVVRFDVTAWLEELPSAVIGLYNQRPGDADAYPIAAIAVEDGIVTWTVTSTELTKTGEGRCELVAIAGEVVAKSMIFRTMVFDALDGSGEAPEPWEEWQQQLIILKNEAEQAADRAEEAVEHCPRRNQKNRVGSDVYCILLRLKKQTAKMRPVFLIPSRPAGRKTRIGLSLYQAA